MTAQDGTAGPPPGAPSVLIINNMVTPYTARLLNALAGLFQLSVSSCSAQEANRNWQNDLNIRFRHDVLPGFAIQLSSSRFAHVNRGLGRAIRAARPALVILNGFFPTMFVAAVMARLRGLPMIVQVDGWAETMPRTPYHAVVRRLMIAWCAGAIVCSEKGAQFFERCGLARDKIFVARLVPAWPGPEQPAAFADRPYDVLWVSQMNEDVKNVSFFLAFVNALHAIRPNPRVRVVGNGPARDAMLAGLSAIPVDFDHIAYVPWTEIEPIFSSAKLMALPSKWEPWGLVCNEAMQCGTPCIVSPHVGAAGELVTGDNGFVEPLDAQRWAAAAATVLGARETWEAKSGAALAAVRAVTFDNYLGRYVAAVTAALA